MIIIPLNHPLLIDRTASFVAYRFVVLKDQRERGNVAIPGAVVYEVISFVEDIPEFVVLTAHH